MTEMQPELLEAKKESPWLTSVKASGHVRVQAELDPGPRSVFLCSLPSFHQHLSSPAHPPPCGFVLRQLLTPLRQRWLTSYQFNSPRGKLASPPHSSSQRPQEPLRRPGVCQVPPLEGKYRSPPSNLTDKGGRGLVPGSC